MRKLLSVVCCGFMSLLLFLPIPKNLQAATPIEVRGAATPIEVRVVAPPTEVRGAAALGIAGSDKASRPSAMVVITKDPTRGSSSHDSNAEAPLPLPANDLRGETSLLVPRDLGAPEEEEARSEQDLARHHEDKSELLGDVERSSLPNRAKLSKELKRLSQLGLARLESEIDNEALKRSFFDQQNYIDLLEDESFLLTLYTSYAASSKDLADFGFNMIYEKHHKWLLGYIRRQRLPPDLQRIPPDTAEDIEQQIWANLLRRKINFKEGDIFRKYLAKVARNQIHDTVKVRNYIMLSNAVEIEDIPIASPSSEIRDHEYFDCIQKIYMGFDDEKLRGLVWLRAIEYIDNKNRSSMAREIGVPRTSLTDSKSKLFQNLNYIDRLLQDCT